MPWLDCGRHLGTSCSKGSRAEPTALARDLAAPIAVALDAVRAAVELNRPFDPQRSREQFTIGASDYSEFVLGPDLVASLQARAPGVSVVFRHADRDGALRLLDEDRAHLALGIFPEPPARVTRIVLMRDRFAVLTRSGHPAAAGPDLDAYLAVPHLLVSAVASRQGAVDRALAAIGRSRTLAAMVSHHLVVAPILRRSDLVCTLAGHLASPIARACDLPLRPPPGSTSPRSPPRRVPQPLHPAAGAPLVAHPGRRDGTIY
jgi:DNA-binding transcriptional LysR family regulator